jgi:ATP-binding cassette subfamily C protein
MIARSYMRQMARIVDAASRRWLAVLVAISAISSLLEAFGITLVFLLFRLIIDPDSIAQTTSLARFRDLLGISSTPRFLALLCAALLIIFVLKIALQLAAARLRLHIEWRLRSPLSTRLLEGYLRSPYAFFLRRDSTRSINTIVNAAGQVCQSLVGIADLASDAILILTINATLFYLQPEVTMVAIVVLAVAGALYLRLGQKRFRHWGRAAIEASTKMYEAATDAMSGIKQIKILEIEEHFTQRFDAQIRVYGAAARRNGFAGQALKPILELFVIVGLLTPIGFTLLRGISGAELVPVLALFAVAAYRLMPGLLHITSVLQSLNFAQASFALIDADLSAFANLPPPGKTNAPARRLTHEIRLEHIDFVYEGTRAPVLVDVSMSIRRGESIGLVGGSGAGKTSLVDIILGLLAPTAGRVLIDGEERQPGIWQHRLFGYVPQETFLINDTIRRNIALGSAPGEATDEARLSRAVAAASLTDVIAGLPQGLDTMVGERGLRLSGGQRQRIAIARALYFDPDILIFDESTSALDATTEAAISRALQQLRRDKTLILIAHRLSTVKNCDCLFFLQGGRLVDSGSFAELSTRNAAFKAMVREMELAVDLAP